MTQRKNIDVSSEPPEVGGEHAYRVWISHTATCATCRACVPCSTSVSLGRAWRKARR